MVFKGYEIRNLKDLKNLPEKIKEEFKKEFKRGFRKSVKG
jgi:hypothetical protein